MIRIIEFTKEGYSSPRVQLQAEAEAMAARIIEAIRSEGDSALLRYAKQFDDLGDLPLKVSERELEDAEHAMRPEVKLAIATAMKNIRQYAELQLPKDRMQELSSGRRLGWIVRPIDAVGCYVPSGRYPLPSTLLMTAVLAQTAGVRRICVTSPRPSIEILGCARTLGVSEVYRVGGAQAIAAMALGTDSIGPVTRIVGPGNAYVAAAKKLLAGEVGIDFVAGPTEILILVAEGDPRVIAADMLAQAEHDTLASAILVTTSEALARSVAAELETQLATLPTANVARAAIDECGAIILVPSMEAGVRVSNSIAPEHLSLHDPSLLPGIENAGTVFLGQNTPESAGDYAAGPSHVLPTAGGARLRGGLSAADFVKVIAIQELSSSALETLLPTITTLARVEGLEAHARSVEFRSANVN